jgi:hypothetical protein
LQLPRECLFALIILILDFKIMLIAAQTLAEAGFHPPLLAFALQNEPLSALPAVYPDLGPTWVHNAS